MWLRSVVFHYFRGDFQNWIMDMIGDEELANQLCFVVRDLSGQGLRSQLLKIVQKRVVEFKTLLPFLSQPI